MNLGKYSKEAFKINSKTSTKMNEFFTESPQKQTTFKIKLLRYNNS